MGNRNGRRLRIGPGLTGQVTAPYAERQPLAPNLVSSPVKASARSGPSRRRGASASPDHATKSCAEKAEGRARVVPGAEQVVRGINDEVDQAFLRGAPRRSIG